MSQPVFHIDLARCTGCMACRVACHDRAALPDGVHWLHVDECEGGTYPHPTLTYRVRHCFHCAEPTCVGACPEEGITRGADGLVQIDQEACTACGGCVEACPFDVIAPLPDGTASKCDGCGDEVAAGWEPTCVRACPMRALGFGIEPTYGSALPARPLRLRDEDFDDAGIGPAVAYWRRPGDNSASG